MPTFIWKYFAGQSGKFLFGALECFLKCHFFLGMRVGEVLRLATNEANSEPATRSSNIYALCVHLQGALKFHSRLKEVSALEFWTGTNVFRNKIF